MKVSGRLWLVLWLVALWSHPALAQVELSGMWQTTPRNQDGSGMTGDTAGVPVSEAGRWRADSWSPEDFDVAEEYIARIKAFPVPTTIGKESD